MISKEANKQQLSKKQQARETVQAYMQQLIVRVNSWLFVERVFLLIGMLMVIFGLWYFLFMMPVQKARMNVQWKLTQVSKEFKSIQARIKQNKLQAKTVEKNNQRQLTVLQSKIKQLDAQLKTSNKKLYSGEEIADILREKMIRIKQLKLLRLNTSPIKVVVKGSKVSPDTLVQQDIEFVFLGGFASTVRYFMALEKSDAQLFWDGVDYVVKTYPESEVIVNLHTYSRQTKQKIASHAGKHLQEVPKT